LIYAAIGALAVGLVLGLLGAGGGIITSPILILLLHHPEKVANTESLAIVAAISAVGALRNYKAGHLEPRTVLVFSAAGVLGTIAGAMVSRSVSGPLEVLILACVMLASGILMLRPQPSGPALKPTPTNSLIMLAAFAGVGLLTALVGVGGGFLIVPTLVLLGGRSMRAAVGTSLGVITINAASGFLMRLQQNFNMDWRVLHGPVIAMFIAVGIAGLLAGSHLGSKIPQRTLKKIFAVFLLVLSCYLAWRQLPRLF
jgi:uncharacterized membrane protein YfcA